MLKLLFIALLVIHGLIHLLGFVKAFGLAPVPQLAAPISHAIGAGWLAAALLMLAAAAVRYAAPSWFWAVGGLALVLSQLLIIGAWRDARVGTAVNVVLLLGVIHGLLAYGPGSLRAQYAAAVRDLLAVRAAPRVVSEADLWPLPAPVQRYLRVTGVVGKPQLASFQATWHGRIRGSATEAWMEFRAEQYSSFAAPPSRLFFMDATMKHLPVDVFHRFVGDAATFRVRLLSAITVVDASGPEMNESETVTLFNDLCILAPSQLIDPAIRWESIDDHRVRARYTRGAVTVAAELVFDAAGELIDFISDDRSQASADGSSYNRQRWRTPVQAYRMFGGRRVASVAEARWQPPSGEFVYLEIALDSFEANVGGAG